jgi:hypothetical protein
MPRQLQTDGATFEVREDALDDLQHADPDVVYICRELTTTKWRELQRQHTRKVLNKASKQMENVTDNEAFSDAIVDYVLMDWRGIVERGGAPAPCTTENKLRLDGVVKAALVGKAGLSQIVEGAAIKETSFRPTPDVG